VEEGQRLRSGLILAVPVLALCASELMMLSSLAGQRPALFRAAKRDTNKPQRGLPLGKVAGYDVFTGAAPPPLSGEAATCVESSSHLRRGCQHGTGFALCSTFSPEILNQVTRQRLLQPAGSLRSVKWSQAGCIPVRSLAVWYLQCQTHLPFLWPQGQRGARTLVFVGESKPQLARTQFLNPPFSAVSPWLGCLQGAWCGSLSYNIRDIVEGVDVELSVRPWRLK
jgi:hypothetical protein